MCCTVNIVNDDDFEDDRFIFANLKLASRAPGVIIDQSVTTIQIFNSASML